MRYLSWNVWRIITSTSLLILFLYLLYRSACCRDRIENQNECKVVSADSIISKYNFVKVNAYAIHSKYYNTTDYPDRADLWLTGDFDAARNTVKPPPITVQAIICESAKLGLWALYYSEGSAMRGECFKIRLGCRITGSWTFSDVVNNEAVFTRDDGIVYYCPMVSEHTPSFLQFERGAHLAEQDFEDKQRERKKP